MDVNKRIGDYEILDELGSGGMGRVFRVRNVISDRVEAMKVLLPDLVGRDDLAARFLREIKLLAALNHPNIAALRTALKADNQLVMIMEYVEGQSLAARVSHGPIACAEALRYIDQVLEALAYAHAQLIVHRDVKPANMILTADGRVKLTDFGIARSRHDQSLTMTGTTTGSLSYMPPEQVRGEETDARSDLYSVGISLYEMVTGRRPFEGTSDFKIMMAHVNEQPRPPIEIQPGLPAALNEAILKAISKDPAARFQSADQFRTALKALGTLSATPSVPRDATVLVTGTHVGAISAVPSALPPSPVPQSAVPARPSSQSAVHSSPQSASVHERTVLDTKTPTLQPVPPRSHERVQTPVAPAKLTAGHPFAYVALGGVLVIVALFATGLYLGLSRAESASDGANTKASTTGGAPSTSGGQAPATGTPPSQPPSGGGAAAGTPSLPAAGTPPGTAGPQPPPTVATSPNPPAGGTPPVGGANPATPPTTAAPNPPGGSPVAAPNPPSGTPALPAASLTPQTPPSQPPPSTPKVGSAGTVPASRLVPPPGAGTPPPGKPAGRITKPALDAKPQLTETNAPPSSGRPPANNAAAPGPEAKPAERAQDSAALDQLETDLDQLGARASAVNNSLDRMQQEQARQGVGLRGDMAARQASMNTNLARAREATEKKDAGRAEKYRQALERDIETLERFLGR